MIIRALALVALVAAGPAHAGNFTVTNCTKHIVGKFDIKVYNSTDLVRISPVQTAIVPRGETAYLSCASPDCTFSITVPRNGPSSDSKPTGGAAVMFSMPSSGTSTQTFTTDISNRATPRSAYCIERKYDRDGVLMNTYDSMVGNRCGC